MPAPKVAASATAILIDMISSQSPAPFGALKSPFKPFAGSRLVHAFLIACIDRVVSTPASRLISLGGTKKMFEIK